MWGVILKSKRMKLNKNFLAELFKLFFSKQTVADICVQYLRYELIPKEQIGYKMILKEGLYQYKHCNGVTSLGTIAQKYTDKDEVQKAIEEISRANLVDIEVIIDQFESYIRDAEFQILNQRIVDLYKDGKKAEAISLSAEESVRINSLSIRGGSHKFLKVFADFESSMVKNQQSSENVVQQSKVSFGIDCLDELSDGGVDRGDTVLWIMRSGVGKSTVLRYHGLESALAGEHVLHIQLEGTKEEVFNKYSQMWTNSTYSQVSRGNFEENEWKKFKKTIKEMEQWQYDIDIYSFERFGEASVIEVRRLVLEYFKVRGHYPTVLIIDSLDLLKTGESPKLDVDPSFMKYKLQRCAQRLKDIAVEFNLACLTATQTGDVPFDVWNDPNKVIDRSYTEGDKTLVKPFSFVFTGNITQEESRNKQLRIYADKLRNYSADDRVFRIKTNFNFGKFYDRQATMKMCDSEKVVRKEEGEVKKKSRGSKIV